MYPSVIMIRQSNKGLTLTELLLAAAILVFVLSGILALFMNCIILNESNRNLTHATSHAQYVMEGIKHTSFADIAGDIASGLWNWNAAAVAANGLTALDSENIVTTASGANPLQVTVTVTWNDRGVRQRNLQLQTLITNY